MNYLVPFLAAAAAGAAQTIERPVRAVTDPGVVTTRQNITPAGVPTVFEGRTYGVAFGRSAAELWVLNATQLYQMDWKENRVLARLPHEMSPGLQGVAFDAASGAVLFSGASRNAKRGKKVDLVRAQDARLAALASDLGTNIAGALAVSAGKNEKGQRLAVLPLTFDNKLAVFDMASGKLVGAAETGIAPFAAVIDSKSTYAYVSNWGGLKPQPGQPSAPTGLAPNADQVIVDSRGVAASGTINRIDLLTMKSSPLSVELHPTGMALDEKNQRLYVAQSNSDSVVTYDLVSGRARSLRLQLFADPVRGISPNAIVVSPDGARIYVACGGVNAIAVMNTATGQVEGMIPTAWYPNALAMSGDGRYLAVSAMLGSGSGWREAPNKRFVHSNRGAVAVIDVPDAAQLANYTTAALENNHMRAPGSFARPLLPDRTPRPVPRRAGDPSPIEHVVFIVKENRTYDQVLGDLPRGNGDPSLVMFGEDITPNQHKLARDFVTLDNFYATGGNSADGHQWLTQANETAYALWPGYTGRSYPFDGTDPIAYSSGGFIWDAALARRKTVRIFGEYAGRLPEPAKERLEHLKRWKAGEDYTARFKTVAPIKGLNAILAANYPPYCIAIPDLVRAQIFLKELEQWKKDGAMPNLTILQLPSNHTYGTSPGASTPAAMVADNDWALGKIVEALTVTQFWPKMAIFVVEDDAQNGVDHVDGHRTVALLVSPFAKRGHVDSTFYSHQSILKTIELILGLPTLSLFDLIAHDMRNSFTETPELGAYLAIEPKQDLFAVNPPASALKGEERRAAVASARMRWDVPDAAPFARLNRILWHNRRGWNTAYPGVRNGVFVPLVVEEEEDDDDDRGR